MILDVIFLWSELKNRDLSRAAVVVADVLRATTVMIRALENGAAEIFPQDNNESALALCASMKSEGKPVLICGEKEGFKRPGYDLGNSPLEFSRHAVDGKSIVHLTTNGTRALKASIGAKYIFIASFANIDAVAERLWNLEEEVDSILFVVSGKEGNYCIEDTVCLGGIIQSMISPPGQGYEITDSSRTAVNLYEFYSERLLDMLKQSDHGYYLEEIGLGEDLPECALVNTTAIVPEMRDGRISL